MILENVGGRVKINLKSAISERYKIANSFPAPITFTALIATDITDHRHSMEKIYCRLLHDAGTVDECCRRFERAFCEMN